MLKTLNGVFNDSISRYNIKVISVYLLWKVFHRFVVNSSGSMHVFWLHVVQLIGTFYAKVVAAVLRFLGEQVIQKGIGFQFYPSLRIVYVEEHCLALPAMLIFGSAIILYGCNGKAKLWFVLMGFCAIILLNILRLVFVGLSFQYFTNFYFSLNHSFIYVAITYTLIFLMIAYWMQKSKGWVS